MKTFLVSSDDCLILKAFKDTSSLREAAAKLKCDPAGLARRVQLISSQHGFLQKVNNRWQLTSKGLELVAWTEASLQSQARLLQQEAKFRLATTMWFSEEVLLPYFLEFKKNLNPQSQFLLTVPQKSFELSLQDGSVDCVIACHPPETPDIEHKQVMAEKWAVVIPKSWQKNFKLRKDQIIRELARHPFIRHSDINEDLLAPQIQIETESGLVIDHLIGVRAAVVQGLGWSIVPRLLVARSIDSQELIELPIELNVKDRKVCVWWLRNRMDVRLEANKIAQWIRLVCDP